MPFEFKFPDVGEGIHEGKLVHWKVKEGDIAEQDKTLAEVETDKAVVEIPSPKKAKILKLHAKEGDTILVGSVLVTFEDDSPSPSQTTVPAQSAAPAKDDSASAAAKAGSVVGFLEEAKDDAPKPSGPEKKAEQRKAIIATLAVRKLAKDLGVEIETVTGTGPGGRITEDDIKKSSGADFSAKETSPQISSADATVLKKYDFYGYIEHLPMGSVRKAVSHKMTESAYTAPHVTLMDDADVSDLVKIREKEKKAAEEKGIKLTYLPFIIKAVIASLKAHPLLNSSLDEKNEEIIVKKYYNIGVAVDTPEGLIVPVLKRAEGKNILQLADEISKFAVAAKERKISLSDLKGGSFSITNIGVISGSYFTPIINFPEVAILGLGKMGDKPIVIDGKVEARKILPLSLSFDHRIVDGAEAARFMKDLIRHLEDPDLLLVEE